MSGNEAILNTVAIITSSIAFFCTLTHSSTAYPSLSKGEAIESDLVLVGVGVLPEMKLVNSGGLKVDNRIEVNDYLEASHFSSLLLQ
ncbi:MAG: FAD-dependent oxidoreductase [Gallionellaceae bacterium]|jgi:NAD(P)H-nitrite reductase large subunit